MAREGDSDSDKEKERQEAEAPPPPPEETKIEVEIPRIKYDDHVSESSESFCLLLFINPLYHTVYVTTS